MSAHSFNHSLTPRASSLHFMRGKSRSQIRPFALLPPPLLHNSVTPAEMYKADLLPLIYAPTIRNKLWARQRKYDGRKMEHTDHCQRDWLELQQHHQFYYFIQVREFKAKGIQTDWNLGLRSEAETSEWGVNMLILTYMECRMYYNFSEMPKHENPNRVLYFQNHIQFSPS